MIAVFWFTTPYIHFALTGNIECSYSASTDFHALVWTSDHLSTAGDGVYAIDHAPALPLPSPSPLPTDTAVRAYLNSLIASRRAWVPPPTFSLGGMEYSVNLYDGNRTDGAWFAKELIVHYEPDYEREVFRKIRRDVGVRCVGNNLGVLQRLILKFVCCFPLPLLMDFLIPSSSGFHQLLRYVMRRAVNGPVTERVEPPDEIVTLPLDDLEGTGGTYHRDNRPYLLEYLYVHYQGEKYTRRFSFLTSYRPVFFVARANFWRRWQNGGLCLSAR